MRNQQTSTLPESKQNSKQGKTQDLTNDPVAAFLLGSYLGTIHGVSSGFISSRVAGGFEYTAILSDNRDSLTITKQRELTTQASHNARLSDFRGKLSRKTAEKKAQEATVDSLKDAIGSYERQADVYPDQADGYMSRAKATKDVLKVQKGYLDDLTKEVKELDAEVKELCELLGADVPVTHTFDLTVYKL